VAFFFVAHASYRALVTLCRAFALSIAAACLACTPQIAPKQPAADGLRAYIAALHDDDAHAAWGLLADAVRKQLRFDDFAATWRQQRAERMWQIHALEDALKGSPDVGERALVELDDGKVVELERDGKAWRLEAELVGRPRAKRPQDALRMFADAIEGRDLGAALSVLTPRRRDGLARQIDGFLSGLAKHADAAVDESGDRATLRWDDGGVRYEIVLRHDDDGWRIDDIYIRTVPKADDADKPAADDEPTTLGM